MKLRASNLLLFDRWRGEPVQHLALPTKGELPGHNCRCHMYELGTKGLFYIQRPRCSGWYVLIYLQILEAVPAGRIAVPTTTGWRTVGSWQIRTNDSWVATTIAPRSHYDGPLAVTLTPMDAGYHGWLWCGGVCPEWLVAAEVACRTMIPKHMEGGSAEMIYLPDETLEMDKDKENA
jgi:hypothetical protein